MLDVVILGDNCEKAVIPSWQSLLSQTGCFEILIASVRRPCNDKCFHPINLCCESRLTFAF